MPTADWDVGNAWRFGSLEYEYGKQIYNVVEVPYAPRKAGSVTTTVLWEMDESRLLANGENFEIIARYTDETSDWELSATNLNTAGLVATPSTTGLTVTIPAMRANEAVIRIVNSSGANRTVTALQLRGRTLKRKNVTKIRQKLTVTALGATYTNNGRQELKWDSELTKQYVNARYTIATPVLLTYTPRLGRIRSFELTPNDVWGTAVVQMTVGDVVSLEAAQLGHDAIYTIIGEAHQLGDGLKDCRHRYYTERIVEWSSYPDTEDVQT
jgi:hypothetical protein